MPSFRESGNRRFQLFKPFNGDTQEMVGSIIAQE